MVSTRKHSDRRRRLLRKRSSAAATNSSAETDRNEAQEVSANILLQANDTSQNLHEVALMLRRGLSTIQNDTNYSVSAFKVNEAPDLNGVHLEITARVPERSKVEPFFRELLQKILLDNAPPSHLQNKNIRSTAPLLTTGPSDYVYA